MNEPTRTKTCARCATAKPVTEFHKRSDTASGRVAHCKPCRKEEAAVRWTDGGDELRERARIRKKELRADAAPERVEELRRRSREQMRRWREANPEEARLRSLRWQTENLERYLETRAARLDRYKDYNSEYHRQYRELNREKIAEYKRRRRAWKAGSSIGPVDTDALWTGHCAICGDHLDRGIRHPDPLSPSVDHIVPLAKGGTHEQANLQWAHLVCNFRKGARLTD